MAIQKRVPASESVTQVEFALTNADYPFVAASTVDDYRMILEEFIPRGDEEYAEFFSVTGGDPATVVELAEEFDGATPTLLDRYDDAGLVEFTVSENCPAVFLSKRGALPRSVYSENGKGRIEAEIPPSRDASAIVDQFLATHQDAELVTKRDQPYLTPMFTHGEFERILDHHLTERQKDVLARAYEAGYYQWPREATGEDVAESLDVSAPTMHKHLRTAERKLISVFFDRGTGNAEPSSET